MTLAFEKQEYRERLAKVRRRMADKNVDVLLVADIANQNWLTGCDGWSFYSPQLVIVSIEDEDPIWIGRAMDAPGAALTAHMAPERIKSYPERFVQRSDRHPADYIAEFLKSSGYGSKRIGYEPDAYHFTPKAQKRLEAGLPNAIFVDCDLLVNWARVIKSAAELEHIRLGARLVENAMRSAFDLIRPGVRQCDVVGEIYKAEIASHPDISGDLTGICPRLLAGKSGRTAHPIWTEERFEKDQAVALGLAGAHRHYHSMLCRTLHLGKPEQTVVDTFKAIREGLEAILAITRPGLTAHDVYTPWQQALDRYGLTKESRIGYSVGLGYPPDWGEHTVSVRAGEDTLIEENMVLHVVIGMWSKNCGLELSETMRVTANGVECLTSFPRELVVKS